MNLLKEITLDLAHRHGGDIIRIHEGDHNASSLSISVCNKGIVFPLTGMSVKYDAVINGYLAESDADGTIDDDVIKIPITPNMTAMPGKLRIDVKIIEGSGNNQSILFTQTVEAYVEKAIIDGAVIIDISGTTIGGRLSSLEDRMDEMEGRFPSGRIPTKTSDLTNDSGFITEQDISGKADTEDIPTHLSDLSDGRLAVQKYIGTSAPPTNRVTAVYTVPCLWYYGDNVWYVYADTTSSGGGVVYHTYSSVLLTKDISGKVDKEDGKGLSSNDFTTAEKNKLSGIEAQANRTIVDSVLSDSSENPVQNKVVKAALDTLDPLPSGGSVGQVLTKTANGTAWQDPAEEYIFADEIPANADHSNKYVLSDGYIYVWQETEQTQEYDANRTDYTGDEAWKNRVLNKKPDLANSTNIKALANESGVLLSAVIPYGPDWGWNGDDGTYNTNTNKTKVEIKGGFGAKLLSMVKPVGSGVGDRAFAVYYYDENGTYLGALSTTGSQIIRWNSEWVAQNAYFAQATDYDMPVCFKCMDSAVGLGTAKYPQVRYVRIAMGISSDGDITAEDVADIKIHVPYYDIEGAAAGWRKTEKHPICAIIDDTFKVSTGQKLYAVGDSITWGYKNTGSGVVQIDSWVKHLIDINGYASISASGSKNLGIPGIGFCVPTLNYGVNPLYLEDSTIWTTDYSDADIITVALGINDWRDTSGVATPASLKTKMYNLFYRLRNGDTQTNANYKGNKNCKIYFILPFNEKTKGTSSSDFYSLGWKNSNYPSYCCGQTLKEFIDFIKDTVNSAEFKDFRIQLIDMTECPAINRYNMSTALLDGLHPAEETHAELGKEIARILSLPYVDDESNSPSKVSDLTNDSGYLTLATLPTYNGGVS